MNAPTGIEPSSLTPRYPQGLTCIDNVKVTVLISNYNSERFICAAIDSALAQTHSNVEVVVVDDGSTDRSRDFISRYGNRIRTVLKLNGGQASAINAGFAASQGDIICMLDSDDFYDGTRVERTLKAFQSSADSGWVFHPVRRVFTDGRTQVVPEISRTVRIDNRRHVLRGKLPGPPGPVTTGLAFSRELLARMLPMPEAIRITSDNYLIFLALALSPGVYVREPLAAQRIHGNNRYTLRGDRTLVQARIHLIIAEELRLRFPQFWRLSNHLFSKALADYARSLQRDAPCEAIIRRYLKTTPFLTLPDVFLRAAYHGGRGLVARQHG
jgi:glycosyltransferase involved in cell wall biosynthesis